MARQIFPSSDFQEARAARLALQDYLTSWARGLTVIVGGRPRKLTASEVQRLALAARARPVRRGDRAPSRVDGVFQVD